MGRPQKNRARKSMAKRLTIHIGLHKTATSTLQKFFAVNQELLAANGIAYPLQLFDNFPAQHSELLNLARRTSSHHMDLLFRGLSEKDADDILLSGENLSSPKFAPVIIKSARKSFGDIRVVMVIRNKVDWLYSQFLHHMRYADYFVTPETFSNRLRFNPAHSFSVWRGLVDEAIVLDYDEQTDAPITRRFLERSFGIYPAEVEESDVKRNASFDVVSSSLLNHMFHGIPVKYRPGISTCYQDIFRQRSTFWSENVLRGEINSGFPDEWWSFCRYPDLSKRCLFVNLINEKVGETFQEDLGKFVHALKKFDHLKQTSPDSRE